MEKRVSSTVCSILFLLIGILVLFVFAGKSFVPNFLVNDVPTGFATQGLEEPVFVIESESPEYTTDFSTTGFDFSVQSSFSDCGTVNNDSELTGDITAAGDCFIINNSNLTFDCKGYSITGNGSGYGIKIEGAILAVKENVTLINCSVENFSRGIYANFLKDSYFENITLIDNDYGLFLNWTPYGSGVFNTFTDVNIYDSSTAGLYTLDTPDQNNFSNLNIYNSPIGAYFRIEHTGAMPIYPEVNFNRAIIDNCSQGIKIEGNSQYSLGGSFFDVNVTNSSLSLSLNYTLALAFENLTLYDTFGIGSYNSVADTNISRLELRNSSEDSRIIYTFLNETGNMTDSEIVLDTDFVAANGTNQFLNNSAELWIKATYCGTTDIVFRKEGFPNTRSSTLTTGTPVATLACDGNNFINYNTSTFSSFATKSSDPVVSVDISFSSANNATTDNITCVVDSSPAESKEIILWYRNSSSIMTLLTPYESGSNSSYTKDYSPIAHSPTFGGNVVWNSSGGYDGKGGYWFDASQDSYIRYSDHDTLDPMDHDMTLTMWVKLDEATVDDTNELFFKYTATIQGGLRAYILTGGLNGRPYAVLRNNTATDVNVMSNASIADLGWHFVAFVIDRDAYFSVYVDGVNTGNTDISAWDGDFINNTIPLYIGRGTAATTTFNGSIDDFMIYNVSLSAEQIMALYENRTDFIVSQQTVKGETWMCTATANYGEQDTSADSSTLTVQNSGPVAQNVVLNSSDSLNRTSGDLNGYWTFYDVDGDSESANETKWFNDSVEVSVLANLTSVDSGNTTTGESWIFSVRVYDGTAWSSWVNSSALTIENTASEVTQITINATTIYNYSSDDLYLWVNATDVEGDRISYFGDWYKDNGGFVYEVWNVTQWQGQSGNALTTDEEGNVYLAGQVYATYYDYAVIKYNSSGEIVWYSALQVGSNYGVGTGIVLDSDNNVFVSGYVNTGSNNDYAIFKLNSSGSEVWNTTFAGPNNVNDYARGIALDSAGNVYVTGYEDATTDNYITVKYNSTGGYQWNVTYNGTDNGIDQAYGIAIDSQDNIYVTGYADMGANNNYVTVKYNTSGDELSVLNYNGPGGGNDYARGIAIDNFDNVYIVGMADTGANYDYHIVKYNSLGSELWNASFNGPDNGDDGGYAIGVDDAGNAYVTGYVDAGSYNDYGTVKFNRSGAEVWNITYDGIDGEHDYGYAIAVDNTGNVYVSGYSDRGGAYGYGTVKYGGGFILKNQTSGERLNLDILSSSHTSGGEDWYACVATNDNTSVSETYCSDTITINPDPSVTLNYPADDSIIDTNVETTFNCTSQDVAGLTNVTLYIWNSTGEYYTNTTNISGTQNTTTWDYSIPDITSYEWNCEAVTVTETVRADTNYSFYVNTVPVMASAVLNSSLGTNYSDEDLYCWVNATDGDDHNISYYGDWYKNNISYVYESWAMYFDNSSGDDRGYAIDLDSDENVYVGGYTGSDILVVKYNSSGSYLTNYTVHKTLLVDAYGIDVDSDGNIHLTGGYSVYGDTDFFTIKLNSTGGELWSEDYDYGGNNDEGNDIAVDSDGNVYVVGTYYNTGLSRYNSLMMMYNSSGTRKWASNYPISTHNYGEGVALDSEGNAYFALRGVDVVRKYNSSGSILGTFSSIYCTAIDIAVDSSANFYVAGTVNNDFCVVKYDSSGNEVFNYTFDAGGNEGAYGIDLDDDGNIYLAGFGSDDFITVKVNSSGDYVWNISYVGDVGYGLGIAVADPRTIYVTGYTNASTSTNDAYTMKYVTGFKLENQSSGELVNADILGSDHTTKDYAYKACVTPYDGIHYGDELCSNELTVLNTAPEVQSVTINTSSGENITSDTLYGNYVFYDADDDSESDNETKWFNNSVEVTAYANLTSVASVNTSKYETWIFGVRVYDGTLWSSWVNSSSLTIENAAPNVSAVVLNSTSVNNYTTDNLTCYATASDVDGDPFKNITNWYKNSVSLMVLNMPFESNLTAEGGTKVRDYSPYGNNGTVSGAIWNSTGGYDGFGAYEFDGVDDSIIVSEISLTSKSIVMWILNSTGWFFIANASGTTYLNGAAASVEIPFNTTHIGVYSDGTYFNGTMDDVQIYNLSLTADQISALYNNRTDLIVSQETDLHDVWQCSVSASDGEDDSASEDSNTLTIMENWVITSDYTLTENKEFNGSGYIIIGDDLTFDCAGYYIQGNGSGVAIKVNGTNVNITDCNITEFEEGVNVDPGTGFLLEHTYLSDVENCTVLDAYNLSTIWNNTYFNCSENAIALINGSYHNLIYQNSFNLSGYGVNILNGTNNTVYNNSFYESTDAHANSVADNYFNNSEVGNTWDDIWDLDIYDSNDDGLCDRGSQYPYNNTNGANVSGAVNDYLPIKPNIIVITDACTQINQSGVVYLLNDSITNHSGTCFTIYNNSVTIDCDGSTIDGDSVGTTDYGVTTNGYNYTTIKNCYISDFSNNIRLESSLYSNITDVELNKSGTSDDYGIFVSYANYLDVSNIQCYSADARCYYLQYTDYSTIDNVTASSTEDGLYLYFSDYCTISNLTVTGTTSEAVVFDDSTNNLVLDSNLSNNVVGIYTDGNSDYNNVTNSVFDNNSQYGVRLYGDHWYLRENEITNNYYDGVYTNALTYIYNNTITDNLGDGIEFGVLADNSEVINNTVRYNGGMDIEIASGADNVLIYNNYLEHYNLVIDGATSTMWNTTNETHGGNYWELYDSDNEGCVDGNGDGYCDTPYEIKDGVNDSWPHYTGTESVYSWNCSTCDSCNDIISNNATPGDTINLTADISGHSGTCINMDYKNLLTFDCLGNMIDGDSSGTTNYGMYAPYSSGEGSHHTMIRNCYVGDFGVNIYLQYSTYSNITNTTLNSSSTNDDYGISTSSSNYLTITDCRCYNADETCFSLYASDYSTLDNLTVISESSATNEGIEFSFTDYSTISNASVTGCSGNSINLADSTNNLIIDSNSSDNAFRGIVTDADSDYTNITNCIANDNIREGFYILSAYSYITKNEIKYNGYDGIYSNALNYIYNNTITDNLGDGIQFSSSADSSEVYNNTIRYNGGMDIELGSGADNILIYNNYLETYKLIIDSGTGTKWNITNETYGGNYWELYDSDGEGCVDGNGDGYCDTPYEIKDGVNDSWPHYTGTYSYNSWNCSTCDSCNDIISNHSTPGDTINLTANITDHSGTCINLDYKNLLTFDCLGNRIDGDSSGSTNYGIYTPYSNSEGSHYTTIRNCYVGDFGRQIYIQYSTYSNITNIELNSSGLNDDYGVRVDVSNYLDLSNAQCHSAADYCFYFSGTDHSTIQNISSESTQYGFVLTSVDYTNLSNATVTGATAYSGYLTNSDHNLLTEINITDSNRGLVLDTSDSNNVSDSIFHNSTSTSVGYGVFSSGYYNLIYNNEITNNKEDGIYSTYEIYIINNTITNSTDRGIDLTATADNSDIINNTIMYNDIDIYIASTCDNVIIYNNYLYNGTNVTDLDSSYWNSSTGGNRWDLFDQPWEGCYDADDDDICDDANMTIDADSIDYLPLATESLYCGDNLTEDETLQSDWSCSGDGLTIVGDNLQLDCNGFVITGNGSGTGIKINGTNVNITNCNLTGFDEGIVVDPGTGFLLEHTSVSHVPNCTVLNAYNLSTIWNNTYFNCSENAIALINGSYHNLIYQNSFNISGYGVNILSGTNNTVYNNSFYESSDAHANSVADNYFNSTVGNTWDDILDLEIYDNDSDGLGDMGDQYPYNNTNGANVTGEVNDYRPFTTKRIIYLDNCTDLNLSGAIYRMNASIPGHVGTCFTIYNNSVTLDCQGYTIDGDSSGTTDYGITTSYYNYTTIKNCYISDFGRNIYLTNSYSANLTNLQFNGSGSDDDYGLSCDTCSDLTLTDSISYFADAYGLFIRAPSSYPSPAYITNVTSMDSGTSNLHLERIEHGEITNVTLAYGAKGISTWVINDNTFRGLNITNTSNRGIDFSYSDRNSILDSSITNCTNRGINVDANSDDTLIQGNTIQYNYDGINSAIKINITNNTITNNYGDGIEFTADADNSIVINNTIRYNSGMDIEIASGGNNIQIYNNYLESYRLVIDSATGTMWNTTNETLGGNYWELYDSDNEGCVDSNNDTYCDTPYEITTGVNDSWPHYTGTESVHSWNCSSCETCNDIISNYSTPGDTINLTANITDHSGTCINLDYKNFLTFDCLDNTIDGDSSATTNYGIYTPQLDSEGSHYTTIRNCEVRDFGRNLYIQYSTYSNITNILLNSSTGNDDRGLSLENSPYSTLTDVQCYNADQYCYYANTIEYSSFSNLLAQYANIGFGILNADYSTFDNLTAVDNSGTGYSDQSSTGSNISNLNISNNGNVGVSIPAGSINHIFTNLTVFNNTNDGISLGGLGNTVRSSTITYSTDDGVYASAQATLINNTITNNSGQGIEFGTSADNSLVINNTIQYNVMDIYIPSGCTGLSIYNNVLVNGTGVYNVTDLDSNDWNSSTGGNRWEYFDQPWEGCYDADGDGVCDNANMTIDADSVDYLPLATEAFYCGDNMTQDETLVADWSCSGDALSIVGDNLQLDCAGYSITGDGSGIAIKVNGSNVNITNCNISMFGEGIDVDPGTGFLLEHTYVGHTPNCTVLNAYNLSTIWNNTYFNCSENAIAVINGSYHNLIYQNSFNLSGYGVNILSGTNNTVYNNSFYESSDAHANSVADNYFNNSAVGNSWEGISSLEIYDTNSDGIGDSGSQYPYNATNGGNVTGEVNDYLPLTTKTDSTDPVVTLVSPDDNYWDSDGNVTFVCNATDAVGLANISLYHNIGGTWELNQTNSVTGTANETNFTINNIPDNNTGYLWNCEATDTSSNSALASGNRTLYVDTINPAVTIEVNDTPVEFGIESVSIDWNTTDDNLDYSYANVSYPNGTLLEESTDNSTDFVFTPANLTVNGTYTVYAYANDSAGNENLTNATFDVTDTTDPVVTLVSPDDNYWDDDGSVTFTCNATNQELANISLYHNINGTWLLNQTNSVSGTENETSFTILGIPDDNTGYLWNCEATDSSGNSAFASNNRTLYVDSVIPAVTIDINDTTLELGVDSVTIDWNTSDLNIDYIYANVTNPDGSLLENSTNSNIDFSFVPANLTQTGTYTVYAYANDSAGNENLTTATFDVTDTTNPVVTLVSPDDNYWDADGSVTFTCNATNEELANISLYHNIDGTWELNQTNTVTGIANETSFTVNNIPDNNTGYLWSCEATDSSGNSAFASNNRTLYVDSVNPDVTISINDTTLEYTVDSVTIDWNASDLNLDYIYANLTKPDGALLEESTDNSTDFSFVPDNLTQTGTYIVNAYANDSAGNENLTTATFDVVDSTATVSTLVSPDDNYWDTDGSVTFTCNGTDSGGLANISLYHDIGGTWELNQTNVVTGTANETSFTVDNIPDNNTGYLWNCEATDSSGNPAFASNNRTLSVDSVTPDVAISINDTTLEYGVDSVTIDWNATDLNVDYIYANVTKPDGALLEESIDNSTDFSFVPANLTQTGTYTVNAYANDSAGNENLTTATFDVTDTTNPVVTLVSPDDNYWDDDGSVTFTCNATNKDLANISLYHNIGGTWELNQTNNVSGTENETSFTINNIPDNNTGYLWNCEATDGSSNSAFASNNRTLYVDSVNPSVTIEVNDTTLEYGVDSVTVDWNATDLNVDYIYANVTYPDGSLLEESTDNSTDFVFTPDNLTQLGTYTVNAYANDSAGNENLTTATFDVTDTTDPVVTLVSPDDNYWDDDGSVTFTCNATNKELANISLYHDIGGTWELNQTNVVTGTANETSFTINNIPDNNTGYLWNCEATDGSSNSAFASNNRTLYVDSVNPNVTLVSPDDNYRDNDGSVTFTCNATNQDLANISLYHDIAGTWELNQTNVVTGTANETSFTINNIPENNTGYLWNCEATDASSNSAFASENRTLFVDTTNPQLTIVSPQAQTYQVCTLDFNVSANENLSDCKFTINNWVTNYTMDEFNSTYFNYTYFGLNNTQFTAEFWCNDTAGNINDTENVVFSINYTNISTCSMLQCMKYDLDEDYVLNNSIDCSETTTWNSGDGFDPIGDSSVKFTGSFDGQGYNITDLYINRTASSSYSALFDETEGSIIENVGMIDVNITGKRFAGLAGAALNTNITNCFVTGYLKGFDTSAAWSGGVNGWIEDGNIVNCYFIGTIDGNNKDNVGGITSNLFDAELIDSYFIGNISGKRWIGGLVGSAGITSLPCYANIVNSYASGNVQGSNMYVGGLVGESDIHILNFQINDSYFRGNVTGTSYVGGAVGEVWNNTYINNVSVIGNITGSSDVGGLVGGSWYRLFVADSYAIGDIFSSGNYVGGLVSGVDELNLENSYFRGNITSTGSYVGGLVGWYGSDPGTPGGSITNCYAIADITASSYAGGIAGYNFKGNITDSYSAGNLSASSNYVGGLVGDNIQGGLTDSFSAVTVYGASNLGGLVGSNTGTITNSYWDNSTDDDANSCYNGGNTGCTAIQNNEGYFKGDNYPDAQSREPFVSWDFVNVWDEVDFDYPVLQWQGTGADYESGLVYACGELTKTNYAYTLQNNIITAGTCFNLTGDNVALDCSGYSIEGDGSGVGVKVNGSNVNITNCDISEFEEGINVDPGSGFLLEHTYVSDAANCTVLDAYNTSTIGNNTYNSCTENAIVLMNGCYHNLIYQNTVNQSGYGVNILSGTNNTVYNNSFYESTDAHANSVAGNYFNNSAIGNNWDDILTLDITDSDLDGIGDGGTQYPYNNSNGGNVTGEVNDFMPPTTKLSSIIYISDCSNLTEYNKTYQLTTDVTDAPDTCMVVLNDSVTLDCVANTIDGQDTGYGVYLAGYNTSTITNCTIQQFNIGIFMNGSQYSTIKNCNITDNNDGMVLLGGYFNVSNNNIYNNKGSGRGVWLKYEAAGGAACIATGDFGCTVNADCCDWPATAFCNGGTTECELIVVSHSTVADNRFWNNTYAVLISNEDNETVDNNVFWGNEYAVYVNDSLEVNVTYNTLYDNNYSVFFLNSNDSLIANNTINDSVNIGLYLYTSFDDDVVDNTFRVHTTAVYLKGSGDNLFYGNYFYDSSAYHVEIVDDQGNDFNNSVSNVSQGNYWDDIYDNILAIGDSDNDGYGDTGAQYPYNNTSGNVTAGVVDYGPIMPTALCGNGVVESGESCDDGNVASGDGCSSTCATEVAQPPGGGGGVTPPPPTPPCSPSWSCTPWSPATCPPSGQQTRTCTDTNGCGTTAGKPAESQSCCYPSWSCSIWSQCINGLQTRTCTDTNSCGTTTGKPAESQSCVVPPSCDDGIQNQGEEGVDCGGPCDACEVEIVEEPIPPEEEKPAIVDAFGRAIEPLHSPKLSCVQRETKKSIVMRETTVPSKLIPLGYELIASPVKLSCDEETLELYVYVPEDYSDVKALQCVGEACAAVEQSEVAYDPCNIETVATKERKVEVLEPEYFPVAIEEVSKKLVEGETLASAAFEVTFEETLPGVTAKLSQPKEPVPEPKNTLVKIITTPLVITLTRAPTQPLYTRVSVPLTVDPDIDPQSISIAVRQDDQWDTLDTTLKEDSAEARFDISSYVNEANEVKLALMGVICPGCQETSLDLVYTPPVDSRNAVVMVHGLGSSPSTFNAIIGDIRATQQPWQAWTFRYATNQTIEENAIAFADALQEASVRFDKLYIAAHSLGGLVTHQALAHAYYRNLENPESYTFVRKVSKVVVVGTPHEKLEKIEILDALRKVLTNVPGAVSINYKGPALEEMFSEREPAILIPWVDYYAIAGTKPYLLEVGTLRFSSDALLGYTEFNDGIIPVSYASMINEQFKPVLCENYWEIGQTHTDLLDDPASRIVIEKVIASEIFKDSADTKLLGHMKLFKLRVQSCSPDDTIVLVGKKIPVGAAADPTGCSCGNGICGVDENQLNCPKDCVTFIPYVTPRMFKTILFMVLLVLLTPIGLGAYMRFIRRRTLGKIYKLHGLEKLWAESKRIKPTLSLIEHNIAYIRRTSLRVADQPPEKVFKHILEVYATLDKTTKSMFYREIVKMHRSLIKKK